MLAMTEEFSSRESYKSHMTSLGKAVGLDPKTQVKILSSRPQGTRTAKIQRLQSKMFIMSYKISSSVPIKNIVENCQLLVNANTNKKLN